MEKKDEFVEMRVRTIDEAMNVDKLIGHLTFNQVLDDEEKMDIMMLDGQNFKLLLEEVNEPHRMMLGLSTPTRRTCCTRLLTTRRVRMPRCLIRRCIF